MKPYVFWLISEKRILSYSRKHVDQHLDLKRHLKNCSWSENLMKPDLKGKLSVDTSALIELIYCDKSGQNFKEALESDVVEAWTTEIAIAELRYVLCRKLGWRESTERVNKLLASGYIKVEDISKLINEASKTKCRRAISLPDCFTLALAQEIRGNALFARKEQDLTKEMQKAPFEVNIIFLEDEK
jgi:predicted nucleic acid-binding protein